MMVGTMEEERLFKHPYSAIPTTSSFCTVDTVAGRSSSRISIA